VTVGGGVTLRLDGSGTTLQPGAPFALSNCTFAWQQVDLSGKFVPITNAGKKQASITVPDGEGVYLLEFKLTVTDPYGMKSSDSMIILVDGSPDAEGETFTAAKIDAGFASLVQSEGTLELGVCPRDENGDLITSASPADFSLRNMTICEVPHGTPVSVTSATVADVEIRLPVGGGAVTGVLDFDSSGSMGPIGDWPGSDPDGSGRRDGGNAFISQLAGGNDFIAIMDFGSGANSGFLYSRLHQGFTNNTALMAQAFDGLSIGGHTPLWGSAMEALGYLYGWLQGQGGVLVLLTDGHDTVGAHSMSDVRNAAIQQSVQVYTIGLADPNNLDLLDRYPEYKQVVDICYRQLVELADATHGRFALAIDSGALADAFAGIGVAITEGYYSVTASLSFPLRPSGWYRVQGELVTTIGEQSAVTPIDIHAKIGP